MNVPTIFFIGTGVGRDLRGFEAHTIDLFNHVRNEKEFKTYLIRGGGVNTEQEITISSISRKSRTARVIGYLLRKNPYTINQLSFLKGLIRLIYRMKPTTLYLGEPILFNHLCQWRNFSGMNFNMIFYTGGNTIPLKMRENDVLQLVTPSVISLALKRGVHRKQMIHLPHFINIPAERINDTRDVKEKLGISADRKIVLSVGAIDSSVKRMDYLIEEISKLNSSCFLILLGEEELETPHIKMLAEQKLGAGNYYINRIERNELTTFYQIADVFVLASLKEGFGLVTIEALIHGLPVIVHDHEVSRYVLRENAFFEDLSKEGNLTRAIEKVLLEAGNVSKKKERRDYVIDRFSWNNVSKDYLRMIQTAIQVTGSEK